MVEGGDMALWSLPSSSFVWWSTGPIESSEDSEILLSLLPSLSSLPALRVLVSVSPPAGYLPAGGEAVVGEGTGLGCVLAG